jgi:hypothetical protein
MAGEAGSYLAPEAWGQPAQKGENFARQQEMLRSHNELINAAEAAEETGDVKTFGEQP